MHSDSSMNSKLFCLLICVFASQLIKPSPFTSWWGGSVSLDLIFMIFWEQSRRKTVHQVFSASKGPLIDNNQSTNYTMTVYFTVHTVTHPSFWRSSWWVKNQIYCKTYFVFYVLFILWVYVMHHSSSAILNILMWALMALKYSSLGKEIQEKIRPIQREK